MKKTIFFSLIVSTLMLSAFEYSDYIGTSLKITVRNDLGNIESGVLVTLYKNKEDFQQEENFVLKGFTNDKGIVSFKGLNPKAYYVTAVKGDMNNYGAGVQTNPLEANKVNKVTIIIE